MGRSNMRTVEVCNFSREVTGAVARITFDHAGTPHVTERTGYTNTSLDKLAITAAQKLYQQ